MSDNLWEEAFCCFCCVSFSLEGAVTDFSCFSFLSLSSHLLCIASICCFLVVIVLLYSSLMLPPYMWRCTHVKHCFVFVWSSTVPLLNLVHHRFALIHNQLSRPWVLCVQCVLFNVRLLFATLGEGKAEATCNADEGCWGSQESRGSIQISADAHTLSGWSHFLSLFLSLNSFT